MPVPPFPLTVSIPLLNPNEIEGVLVSLFIVDGQKVLAGEVLGVLETTKSTGEIIAEREGYVARLRMAAGQSAQAGQVLCYLVEAPGSIDVTPEARNVTDQPVEDAPASDALPPGLRITRPALLLARQHQVDLASLPSGPLVTEKMVQGLLAGQESAAQVKVEPQSGMPFDPSALVIYGGGGHGKSLIELVRVLNAYHLAGVVDDGLPIGSDILGLRVLGGKEVLGDLYRRGVQLAINAVGGIGNLSTRLKVFDNLSQAGFSCPAVVHPTAFVEASTRLAGGVQVFPKAYVGSSSQVGFGAIINTGVIVSHDCVLGETVNLSPGAILAGGVQVGARTLIGMGVTVYLEVKIGVGARIGNGATVKADVPAGAIVKAGSIWPL